jgi:hypothetical protein
MSPYWLHPDEWPDGGRHLRPRNHGPSPAASPRANAQWIGGQWIGGEWAAPPARSRTGADPDSDQVLALRVAEGLVRDQAVRGRRVEVTVVDAVVTLDGELESPHARSAAEDCARATPGVSAVANRLVVS